MVSGIRWFMMSGMLAGLCCQACSPAYDVRHARRPMMSGMLAGPRLVVGGLSLHVVSRRSLHPGRLLR